MLPVRQLDLEPRPVGVESRAEDVLVEVVGHAVEDVGGDALDDLRLAGVRAGAGARERRPVQGVDQLVPHCYRDYEKAFVYVFADRSMRLIIRSSSDYAYCLDA